MNSNTISGLYGGTGRSQIASQTNIGTTETAFLVNTDNGTANPAVISVPTGASIAGAVSPLDPSINPAKSIGTGRQYGPPAGASRPAHTTFAFNSARPFRIRLTGVFTSAVASNDLKLTLYLGSSATLGSNTSISAAVTTGSGGNFGAVSGQFYASYFFVWDSTSGKLNGSLETAMVCPSGVATTLIAPVAVTQVAAAAVSNLQFVASAKWNASNAGNTVNVTEFTFEQV